MLMSFKYISIQTLNNMSFEWWQDIVTWGGDVEVKEFSLFPRYFLHNLNKWACTFMMWKNRLSFTIQLLLTVCSLGSLHYTKKIQSLEEFHVLENFLKKAMYGPRNETFPLRICDTCAHNINWTNG
jgi:hypothetical protein